MQHKDGTPKSSRPSLLTPAQQAEADRNRILSQLESGKAGAPALRRKRPRVLWIAAAAGCLAIAVMLGAWLTGDVDVEADTKAAAVAAATEPGKGGAAAALAGVGVAAGASAAASEVSADDVLASAAPAAVIQEDHAARAQDKQQSLSDMLDNKAQPTEKPDAGMLSKALESPSSAVAAAAPKPASKPATKEKPKPKPAATVAKSPRAQEKVKNTPEEENDVALLAALVAHTQSEHEAAAPKPRRLSLDEQIAQCKKLSKTKETQCRERVCDGRSKTGACKVQR